MVPVVYIKTRGPGTLVFVLLIVGFLSVYMRLYTKTLNDFFRFTALNH